MTDTYRLCMYPTRNGQCRLDFGHRGVHAVKVFQCASCGRRRRGSPHQYMDDEYGSLPLCFLCVRSGEEGELLRQQSEAQLEDMEMEELNRTLRFRDAVYVARKQAEAEHKVAVEGKWQHNSDGKAIAARLLRLQELEKTL